MAKRKRKETEQEPLEEETAEETEETPEIVEDTEPLEETPPEEPAPEPAEVIEATAPTPEPGQEPENLTAVPPAARHAELKARAAAKAATKPKFDNQFDEIAWNHRGDFGAMKTEAAKRWGPAFPVIALREAQERYAKNPK